MIGNSAESKTPRRYEFLENNRIANGHIVRKDLDAIAPGHDQKLVELCAFLQRGMPDRFDVPRRSVVKNGQLHTPCKPFR